MPSPSLAEKAANAVAVAIIKQDQAATTRMMNARVERIDGQLKTLRGALTADGNASPDLAKTDGADDTRMLKLMYAALSGRYRQALVEKTSATARLQVVQPPVATEQVAPFPRQRNTIVGLLAGALLTGIASLGLAYWRSTGVRRNSK
jgi:uncharacterized protein involved in exopolysaccharide biosynthesis